MSKLDLIVHKHNKEITGEISINGSKNSALAIIPAALLSSGRITLNNVPRITDVLTVISILEDLGHFVEFKQNTLIIERNNKAKIIFSDKVKCLRGSYYFISVYLSIFKKLYIKECGGCNLGDRPINYHLDAFNELGVKIRTIEINDNTYNHYYCEHINSKEVNLPYKSVGTTINIILLSVVSNAIVTINNASIEPEVIDLCNFLKSIGGSIIISDNTIIIHGVKTLSSTSYTIISDRIEAGTYLALGTLPNINNIKVTNINPTHLDEYIKVLKDIGYKIKTDNNSITINKSTCLKPIDIITSPYPGFPTDLAPIISIVLAQINGTSTLTDTVFINRYSHVKEINKLGGNIIINNNTLFISKSHNYINDIIYAHDLRCAAALLLYSIGVNQEITIKNIEHLFRGYVDPIKKLQAIGITCSINT